MLAKYATIVRRAGALTAVAAAIMVAVSAALVGVKGLIGGLIGVAIVIVFFGTASCSRICRPVVRSERAFSTTEIRITAPAIACCQNGDTWITGSAP